MIRSFPLSHLPVVFNTSEVRALMDDLGLIPMSCFKSSYLFPYLPIYVHVPYSDKKDKFCDASDKDLRCSMW